MIGCILDCPCLKEDGPEKIIGVPVKFESEEQLNEMDETSFDTILDELNAWINANGYPGFYIDDVVEQKELITEDTKFPKNGLDLTKRVSSSN